MNDMAKTNINVPDRGKKHRPRYTKEQKEKMITFFNNVTRYPKMMDCEVFAAEFGRPKQQIYRWFEEYRRQKGVEARREMYSKEEERKKRMAGGSGVN